MNTYTDKTNAHKTEAATGGQVRQLAGGKNAVQLQDNRPSSVMQKKRSESLADRPAVQRRAKNTGLPDQLKSGIENLSGYSMNDVKVHYNSDKPAQLQALAYAQGTDIHVGPGQEKHLAHEAWHVVQQKQGRVRPTVQLKGGVPVNDNKGLEREADLMGKLANENTALAGRRTSIPKHSTTQLKAIQLFPNGFWMNKPFRRINMNGSYRRPLFHQQRTNMFQNNPKRFSGQRHFWKPPDINSMTLKIPFIGNILKQRDMRANPDKYKNEKGRLGALYETSRYGPGTVGNAMYEPVKLFHLLFGDIGSATIGEHYRKDIPDLLGKPDTDDNLESVGRVETVDYWKKRTGLAYLMGNVIGAETRGNILKYNRDRKKDGPFQIGRNLLKEFFPQGVFHRYTVNSRYGGLMPYWLRKHLRPEDLQKLVESDSSYSAPAARGELSETPKEQSLPFFGKINQSYDMSNTTVTNQTAPGHVFYPGEVKHAYDFKNFRRTTTGVGTGILPGLNANHFLTNSLWKLQPKLRMKLYMIAFGRKFNS
jgi:hypothetical protein